MSLQPTFYLSHGGGPWPWLRKEMPFFNALERSLMEIPGQLPVRPKAILVISGHWEEEEFTVMANSHPPMVYDYGGFPEFTYHIKYPAPGDPNLAMRVKQLLESSGIKANLDYDRGYDHGTYSVLYPMFPKADVPVLQLSMKSGYNPITHLKAGHALAPLRNEGVLILGSGNSYHDLRMPRDSIETSMAFDNWLQEVLIDLSPSERTQKLIHWTEAPYARAVQPQEDHLIPLMVAVGAAEHEGGKLIYNELVMGRYTCSSFRFGE